MRICLIGKFPPIQGGVSMRTFWSAHALAARGHEVHVVTNAKEVVGPFRMHMRAEDWQRCEADYGNGSVTVHWSDPVDSSQTYIPMASPFISKLAGIAARVHSERPFDIVFSQYLEPYGIAGHLVAQMTGLPHAVRMAGSDAGKLWRHPQLEMLYDHVLRSADAIIAAGVVAERAVRCGVAPERIGISGGFVVPEDLFCPDGPVLDLKALQAEVARDPDLAGMMWGGFKADRPYFGVYGKLGDNKGSFALLAAMSRLREAGLKVGLVALAHRTPDVEERFRARAEQLGLADSILQLPFLPHWRVPEFLRGCLAVCCLEHDFPIAFHAPIVPREVLLTGTCLVGSTEVIRKLPAYEQLPHGYGCIAIEDVRDIGALSKELAALVANPDLAARIGARGRAFASEMQRDTPFPQTLESILAAAAARQHVPSAIRWRPPTTVDLEHNRFPLTQLAAAEMQRRGEGLMAAIDLSDAREVLAAIEQRLAGGEASFRPLQAAVQIEIAIAAEETDADEATPTKGDDPIFRYGVGEWSAANRRIGDLIPRRDPNLRLLEFNYDIVGFLEARTVAELPATLVSRPSYVAVFGQANGGRRDPLLIDATTAQILKLSDGTHSVAQIAAELDRDADAAVMEQNLDWIERVFVSGLIGLSDLRIDGAGDLSECSADVRSEPLGAGWRGIKTCGDGAFLDNAGART